LLASEIFKIGSHNDPIHAQWKDTRNNTLTHRFHLPFSESWSLSQSDHKPNHNTGPPQLAGQIKTERQHCNISSTPTLCLRFPSHPYLETGYKIQTAAIGSQGGILPDLPTACWWVR